MWSDRETDQDCLGYTSYVKVLANICTHQDLAPLTLGVFGSWGSGKTSLMRMLQRRIDADSRGAGAEGSGRTLTLWFNAWQYEGREEAQSALIHAILAALEKDRSLGEEAKAHLKKLKENASVLKLGKFIMKSVITMTPNIDEFIDIFTGESDKLADTMEGFEREFASLIRAANLERIIVFIDDLDRCSSAKVIETFETIKLFLNTPFCTFVIGADAAKIEHAVGEVYSIADPKRQKEYLEKIVQIPFHIPEQDLGDIACYVGMLVIGRHLKEPGRETLAGSRTSLYSGDGTVVDPFYSWPLNHRGLFEADASSVVEELKGILPFVPILGRGLRGNPRHIKRFLNVLSLRRELAKENELEYQPALLVKLAVLEYVDEELFGMIVENVDPVTGRSTLVEEMFKATPDAGAAPESELVRKALGNPSRLEFLRSEPPVNGETELRPYLFLAQTSLSRHRPAALVPTDDAVRGLVASIVSPDPVPSKAAARRASIADPVIAGAVVTHLINELPKLENLAAKTHVLMALGEICRRHKELYPAAVKAVEAQGQLAQGPALAAATLLNEARTSGITIPEGLLERLQSASPLVGALAGRLPGGRRGGR